MQKVIGLDIGSYSIKAVEIVNTFKSYEISNFYESVIPITDDTPQDQLIPQCMERLFRENNLQADRIITAMPGQYISSRIMPFNFSDPRKISAAVNAEIEDQVPFNLEDMIVDHQILGTIDSKTIVLTVMTRKTFLASFLELLQRVKIDPKLVDIDSLAFYNLSPHLNLPAGACVGLVDIGHEKTSLCIVKDGVLRMFRSINLGGRFITEFLARDLEKPLLEAQELKHRVSRVLTREDPGDNLSPEDRMVAERITLASNSIVKELGRTLYSFKSWEKSPVVQLRISGGSAKIANFAQYLSQQLEVEVSDIGLGTSDLKISQTLAPHMAVIPQGVAIGLRAVGSIKRHSQINLRKDEFAYVQDYEQVLKAGSVVLRIIAAALTLLCLSYSFKWFFYNRQITAVQEQYKKEVAAMFPDTKKKMQTGITFTKIRGDTKARIQKEIDSKKKAVDDFVAENSSSGALLALKDISENIPKDIKVDVTLFQYNGAEAGAGKVILKGETDGYATVAAIQEALKKSTNLNSIEEKQSGAKPGTDGKTIEFTLNMNFGNVKTIGGKG